MDQTEAGGRGPDWVNDRTPTAADSHAAQQMHERAEEASELLKALANPQRLRVLCLLLAGERSVGEINADIELSQSALSQHLAVLREKGLVQTRREAQTIYYTVTDGPVHAIMETLYGVYCGVP